MKLKQNLILSFITKFLLVLMLVQFHFSSQIICIESDGRTAIEIASPMGRCPSAIQEEHHSQEASQISQNCAGSHQGDVGCVDCTDVPLKQDVSLTRFDYEKADFKSLSPSYFHLYAGKFKPYILYLNQNTETLLLETFTFVYHPNQTLESIILLI